jgi:hypothetical protein
MGMATSERSDSLSYGASSFVSVELARGEVCPLVRGTGGVEFNIGTVGGGGARTTMLAIWLRTPQRLRHKMLEPTRHSKEITCDSNPTITAVWEPSRPS